MPLIDKKLLNKVKCIHLQISPLEECISEFYERVINEDGLSICHHLIVSKIRERSG